MAISAGGKTGGSMSEINMTPMIDVLLVLLVIFMLAQPLLQKSIDVQLPIESDEPATEALHIVLEVDSQGRYFVNTQAVAKERLQEHLTQLYRGRPDKVLFVKASGEVVYQDVIDVMDAARAAGVTVLGAMLDTPGAAATPSPQT